MLHTVYLRLVLLLINTYPLSSNMRLLPRINAQPQQFRSRIVTNRVSKMPQTHQHIHRQLSINEPFLVGRDGLSKPPTIRPIDSRMATALSPKEAPLSAMRADATSRHNRRAVQHKRRRLNRVRLREHCAACRRQFPRTLCLQRAANSPSALILYRLSAPSWCGCSGGHAAT
jgi:hypothetical protein